MKVKIVIVMIIEIKEMIDKMIFNTCGVILLIIFINIMYQNRYTKSACIYIKNQLVILAAGSAVSIIVLYLYYTMESLLHIDEKYLNGICLALFLGSGGILINKLYNHFKSRLSSYKPTNEEYLFVITISFISIMIRMLFEGMVSVSIPISLLLGRYMWLDTRDICSIFESVKINHNRIKETALLFLIGILLLSFFEDYFKSYFIVNLCFPFVFGLILCFPYNIIMAKVTKRSIE